MNAVSTKIAFKSGGRANLPGSTPPSPGLIVGACLVLALLAAPVWGQMPFSAVLTWTHDGIDTAGYTIEYQAINEPWEGVTDAPNDAREHTHTGIVRGTYRWRVNAYNAAGASAWAYSLWHVIAEEPAATPPSPPNVSVTVQVITQ